MGERPRVVAEHVALAHAVTSLLDDDDVARGQRLGGELAAPRPPTVTLRLALTDRSVSSTPSMRPFSSARVADGFIAAASTAVGSTL